MSPQERVRSYKVMITGHILLAHVTGRQIGGLSVVLAALAVHMYMAEHYVRAGFVLCIIRTSMHVVM